MQGNRARHAVGALAAALTPAAVTVLASALLGREALTDVVMLYLLGVVVISLRFNFVWSITSAVLSVLAFDFFFIRPYLTFTVADLRHVITFGVMLAVAVVIAGLAHRVRNEEATRLKFETERLRSTLLSSISHDLRTPLAVMKGTASALAGSDALAASARRELTSTMLEECERLERLVTNVLDMTRLEAGNVRLKTELQSVEELVGGALNRLETSLRDHPVVVHGTSDLFIACDAALIEQLLVNLLENAAKHTAAGTRIEVSAAADAGWLDLTVRDHGEGIPADELEAVFQKFQRGTRRCGPGSGSGVGLGLAICRAVAEAHGGRIRAERAAGGGLAVRLSLPWKSDSGLPPLPEEAPP